MPPAAVQRKARHSALRRCSLADHHGAIGGNAMSLAPPAAQRAEVLHPTRRRPAKGTLLPCGVLSPADHHGAIGGNAPSLAPTAAQRAEVLHPTRRRPAKGTKLPCGVVSPADHHGAIGGNARSPAPIAAQRAEVLHPTRRRPAKGTTTALRRCEPSRPPRSHRWKRHKPAPPPPSVPRFCIPRAAVQRKARPCPAAFLAQPTTTEPSAETP
jgi:hypothetical protein